MSQFSLSATTQNSNTSRRARLFLFVNEIGESDLDDRRLQSELRPIDPSNRFGANVAGIVFPFPSSRFYETWPSPSVLRTRGTAASGPSSKHLCHRNENENHRAVGAFGHVGGVCTPSTSLSKLAKPLPALASSSPLASSIAIEDFSPCGGWASNGP